MQTDQSVYDKIGGGRFDTGIEYQKELLSLTRNIQDRMLNNLPSNYPKDRNTNLAEFFRAVAKEFARLQISTSNVNEDKYHGSTQTEYLFQILGDSLFLGEKSINENIDDVTYRNFLIRVRNAYFGGSRKDNIEDAVSDIVGLPVTLKEAYLSLRKEGSSYELKDTNKIFFDIFMDDVSSSSSIGLILEDLYFFLDLIKPAHVIYDTRLIWTEQREQNPKCKPKYILQNMEYEAYGTTRIYLVTYLASQVYKYSSGTIDPSWEQATISSADHTKKVFLLDNNKILVYTTNTSFYIREDTGDRAVVPDGFVAGDTIYYVAQKDTADTSSVIDSTWSYEATVDDIYQEEELIILQDGSIIVYNEDTLVYTRDGQGEYRIDIDDILPNFDIAFKAEKHTHSFQFYQTPEEVQENFFKQFDPNIIKKSTFQEYVEKYKDIRKGLSEGYQVIVENGVAVLKNIKSKFYKRADTKDYKEIPVDKYSLFIEDEFEKQFQVDDPERVLTQNEAKNVFINVYGYTGLQTDITDYEIKVAHTGELTENGQQAIFEGVDGKAEMCDRRASCNLLPYYEDSRRYWTWPDVRLCSGFFVTQFEFQASNLYDTVDDTGPVSYDTVEEDADFDIDTVDFGAGPADDSYDLPAWYYLSSDPNQYVMPSLPMLNADGEPASVSDLTVYLNGKLIEDAVETVDPWTGIVTLNFIPPFNTTLRVDYYCSNRYPDPEYDLRFISGGTLHPDQGDLPAMLTVMSPDGLAPRLTWPFEVTDTDLYGDDRDYQINKFPILNQRGELATKDEVIVSVGSIVAQGTVKVTQIDTDPANRGSTLENLDADWTSVQDGDTIIIYAENYLDNTLIYTIEEVNIAEDTIRLSNVLPELDAVYTYAIVSFLEVEDAVEAIRPLLGHVRINFIPPLNTYLRFNYYYTTQERNYLMLPDAVPVQDAEWDYASSGYTPDTAYGSKNDYTMLVDQNPAYADQPYFPYDHLLKVGYRYRAFNLAHTSALNSEQMILNDYNNTGKRASFSNSEGLLNRYDLLFSPEYLNDTDKNVVLNDRYLYKDIVPYTILNPGVPLFVKTFTDDGHYTIQFHPFSEDTYDPDFEDGKDLKATMTIIEPDDSGVIDYNEVCEFETNKQINLHSDLKIIPKPNNGYDAHLTTIDEGGTSLPFRFSFIEQYYPNREQRVTDYLDYINQVPTEYKTGNVKVLRDTTIVKSIEGNFKALNIGDQITVKNVPFQIYNHTTEEYETVYRDLDFVLVEILDFETGRINRTFNGASGQYSYELTRSKTYAVDVFLVEVCRTLVFNGLIGHTYSMPDIVLQHFPGYGDTGVNAELSFPDPDPDPYPRNPDNPWINNPTVSYYPIPQYTIDGNLTRTNRTLGVTGMVNTSQIVDAEGNSFGFTGGSAGVTGPCGALDLGITGPVEYADPRSVDPYDVYQIPSAETGAFISYSEAEYRVQWRNWDQDMMVVMMGASGIMIEDPVNMMDDIGEGIKRSFWDVNNAQLREIWFHGTIMETSEQVSASVAAASYPNGFITLTQDDVDRINDAADPVADLPDLHLGDANYELRRKIIREILHDDSVKVTEIQEFVAI